MGDRVSGSESLGDWRNGQKLIDNVPRELRFIAGLT